MPKFRIAVDDWKLPTFKKHLADAGFEISTSVEISSDLILLTVDTDKNIELGKVIQNAMLECRRKKLN